MALSLRFLGQASRQASQIATPTVVTPRALASGVVSGAVSPRTPRSPRMSAASAGEQLPCFGSLVELDGKPNSRQGSFVGGMESIKTPPGSFLGESMNQSLLAGSRSLPGFGEQDVDIFASFVEDAHSLVSGKDGPEDASTKAGSSRAGYDSPQFGDIDDVAIQITDGVDVRPKVPVLLGRRRGASTTQDVVTHEVPNLDELVYGVNGIGMETNVSQSMTAAQAARGAFMARQARRSGRRLL